MDNDLGPDGERKDYKVYDSQGGVQEDHASLSGQVREVQRLDTDGVTELTGELYEYWSDLTASAQSFHDAYIVRESVKETRACVTGSATPRRTRVTRTIMYRTGLPEKVVDEGDLEVQGDEKCTLTQYTHNPDAWMQDFPARVETHAGTDCASTTNLVSRTETFYDGHAGLFDYVTDGNPTEVRRYTSDDAYITTKATYDSYGRVLTATDGNGEVTRTAYSPSLGLPTSITVTNALNQATTSEYDPRRGQVTRVVDPNGAATVSQYDPLGRLAKVWLPTESTSPSYEFDYALSQSSPSRVTTRRLQSVMDGVGAYLHSYTYLDGLGRESETQTPSPKTPAGATDGRVVVQTRYDDQGRTAAVTAPLGMAGTAGTGLANPAQDQIPSETRTSYDALGRVTGTSLYSYGQRKWGTATTYAGNRYTVIPPTGGATTYVEDVFGRVTQVYEGLGDGTSYLIRYEYDTLDRLTRITDAKGNVTAYTYDGLDNVRTTTDAKGQVIATVYDALGRPVQRRRDSDTGTLLDKWRYDTAPDGSAVPNGIGRLTSATSFANGNAYTVDVTGYDARGRVTGRSVTIPAAEAELAGTYSFSYGYDRADHETSVTYPAAGGLPAETVTQSYTGRGYPTTLVGSATYVAATPFAEDGTLASRVLGTGANSVTRSYSFYTSTRWLAGIKATKGAATLQDDQYAYDTSGNVLRITDATTGQRQCFSYDGRHRLVHGWTTDVDCTDEDAPNGSFGPEPYQLRYGYDALGNIASVTDSGGTRGYTYDARVPEGSGERVLPHAVSAVGSDRYGYDANGQLVSRTVGGVSASFTWDARNWLRTVTETSTVQQPDGSTTTVTEQTSFVYDTEGQRLIRRDPSGTTLYLDGMEVRAADGEVTAVRYYASGRATVAMRNASGVTWLLGDRQGSVSLSVDDQSGAVTRQRYLPFGSPRGQGGVLPTDRSGVPRSGGGPVHGAGLSERPLLRRGAGAVHLPRSGDGPAGSAAAQPVRLRGRQPGHLQRSQRVEVLRG